MNHKQKPLVRRVDLDNRDHVLARFLKENGWVSSRKIGGSVVFYDAAGNAIAANVYNSVDCSYSTSTIVPEKGAV